MNEKIIECIYEAIDEENAQRGDEPPLKKSLDTSIHGGSSALDSLGLVNFVIAVEENIERAFGVSLLLADDRALEQEPSPFASVGSLAAYIEMLLKEEE